MIWFCMFFAAVSVVAAGMAMYSAYQCFCDAQAVRRMRVGRHGSDHH